MSSPPYRLVTRSDFDGLACAVLLREIGLVDEIVFVHPRDMQEGKVAITARDITTNLPYVPGAHLVIDHHGSEAQRNRERPPNYIIDPDAPSAARVVYRHFGGPAAFPRITEDMMRAVDQADSAQYALHDILEPKGWTLLNFLMDSRTGLGRFRDFRISNYQLMMALIEACRAHAIDEILALPDVQERVELYREHAPRAQEQLRRCARQVRNLVILDTREEATIWAVNRFMLYALFPTANISIHVLWGNRRESVSFATGKSILDRSSRTNVGSLMLAFGGGGHAAAGTCQVPPERAEQTLATLIERITADG